MPYLLDADWVIHALAKRPDAVDTLRRLATEGIAIGWITIGELYEGAFGSPDAPVKLDILRQFLHPFPVVNLDDTTMERFAAIRASLRRRGEIIPDFDIILAATALRHDFTVLTYNVRHLRRIPDLRIYQP